LAFPLLLLDCGYSAFIVTVWNFTMRFGAAGFHDGSHIFMIKAITIALSHRSIELYYGRLIIEPHFGA
jgi:hypothetical protein